MTLTWLARCKHRCNLATGRMLFKWLLAIKIRSLKGPKLKKKFKRLRILRQLKHLRRLLSSQRERSTRRLKTPNRIIQRKCLDHSLQHTRRQLRLLLWSCTDLARLLWIQAIKLWANFLSFNESQKKRILSHLDFLAQRRKKWPTNS